jgi:hypothetical protein
MTKEEIIQRIIEFESMMGQFHGYNTRYGRRRGLSLFSLFANAFGKDKYKKVYNQLLEDIKLIYHEMNYDEYMALRRRIITAFEP